MISVVEYAQQKIANHLQQGRVAFDATLGNGHDTAFLLDLVGEGGLVIATDIQPTSIEISLQLLNDHPLKHRVQLHCCSHHRVVELMKNAGYDTIDAAMYNLGYMPGSDKSVLTKPETTIASLNELCTVLSARGVISVCCYTGHPGGTEERDSVQEFVHSLNRGDYSIEHYCHPQKIQAPECFIILKK